MNYSSNVLGINQGLNITSISSDNYLNDNNNYNLSFSSYSSFNPAINDLEANVNQQLTTTFVNSSGTYSSTSGYGLVNAAAAVAKAAGQKTFSDVPSLGGNNWGADLIKAPEAWSKGYTGKGVVVAVLDTGVDYNHPDLKDNIWTNPNPGNGKNGSSYINDVHGWNFVDNNNNVLDTSQIGHGTHVAGTIAGENNGFGVTGIAYDAKIMPVKVLDNSGAGTYTSITNGIYYAVDHGANVINLSLGGSYPNNSLASALQYANSKGVTVVMAAGNDSAATPDYPARYAKNWGLAVGAVDQNNNIANFSNYAGSNSLAYVTAPGVNIYSTIPGNKYTSYSGTSMATPHVAGVVALMLSANHNLTESQVSEMITQTAENSTKAATFSLSASPTIKSMITSTNFSDKLITENMAETSELGVSPIIKSMITSPTINSNMFGDSNLWSQFLSYDQNPRNYSISSDDDSDITEYIRQD